MDCKTIQADANTKDFSERNMFKHIWELGEEEGVTPLSIGVRGRIPVSKGSENGKGSDAKKKSSAIV